MPRGSATTDGCFAYFIPGDSTLAHKYEYSTEKWEDLPFCSYRNSALAIIERKLTAVGGLNWPHFSGKLLTLREGKWVEEYPSINTAGSIPALVSTADGAYLIAIGGYVHHWSPEVNLFQVKSRRWYRLTDLPQPLPFPSATICGDVVHVIGDGANGYSCSLQALPSSDIPIPPQSMSSFIHWTPLPPLPVTRSTAATLRG